MAKRPTDIKEYIKLYDACKLAQQPAHDDMRKYQTFLYDDQWAGIQVDKRAAKPTINMLFSNIEQEVAMLTLQSPTFSVTPASSDDIETAKSLDLIFRIQKERMGLQEKQEDLIRDMLQLGTGLLKTYWDKGNPYITGGDIAITPISPFNFCVDPLATCMEDADYCFYRVLRSKEYLLARYGYTVNLKKNTLEKDMDAMGHEQMDAEGYWAVEYFARPWFQEGKKIDPGAYGVFLEAEKKWLRPLEKTPVPYGDLPFVQVVNIRRSQDFWGISEVKMTMEVQQRLNKTYGYLWDQLRLGNTVKFWTDDPKNKQTTVSMNSYELLHGLPGSKFQQMQPRGLDPGTMNLIAMLMENMKGISGVHDVSSGAPGNVQAASAIQTLAGLGSQRMSVRQRHMSYSMRKMAMQLVGLMKMQYKKARYFRLGEEELKDFTGKDLSPWYDIKVNYEEDLPDDRMTRFNMALQIAQLPPDVQQTLTKIINSPSLTAMVAERNAELQKLASQMNAGGAGNPPGTPELTSGIPGAAPEAAAPEALPPIPVAPA